MYEQTTIYAQYSVNGTVIDDELQIECIYMTFGSGTTLDPISTYSAIKMGLMSILKKMKQKEKDVRLLMLYPHNLYFFLSDIFNGKNEGVLGRA